MLHLINNSAELGHGFGEFILLIHVLDFLLQLQTLSFQLFPVGTFSGEQGFFQ
jgi:hypothetical protein